VLWEASPLRVGPWTARLRSSTVHASTMDGVVLFSNTLRFYLGESGFGAVCPELEGWGAVVLVHPAASPDPAGRGPDRPREFEVIPGHHLDQLS